MAQQKTVARKVNRGEGRSLVTATRCSSPLRPAGGICLFEKLATETLQRLPPLGLHQSIADDFQSLFSPASFCQKLGQVEREHLATWLSLKCAAKAFLRPEVFSVEISKVTVQVE
jgi:hypothetical protein